MGITRGQIVVFLIVLSGRLPLWASRLLGRLLGLFFWLIPNRSRTTTKANIALCFPELSAKAQQKLAFHSLQHTGMLFFEMAAVWIKPSDWVNRQIKYIDGKAIFDAAQANSKGVIIVLPHIGNWEVFGSYIPTVANMVALYEPPRLPELNANIIQYREKAGAKIVPTTSRGVAALLKHLRAGGTSCILPDQVPNQKNRGGVYAPFFGYPVHTMTLITQLIQRTNCQVLGASAKRTKGGFDLEFSTLPEAVYSADEYLSATAINQFVENCIHKMPEQYQWEYKRFRRVPKGSKKLY
jgi:KDO2-lipid IV(A) lauroyltransferase